MRGVVVGALVLLSLLSPLLAGCSSPQAPAELIVQSRPVEEVTSDNTTSPIAAIPKAGTRGHFVGVVVDEAIRPLAGAEVRLPGLDLTRTTDRDGSFGFNDLYPGPYYVVANMTGYYGAEAIVKVDADEFSRAKFVLKAIPPPDPYHVIQSFAGFADLTNDPVTTAMFGSIFCNSCEFDFYLDQTGLRAVIIEAMFDSPDAGNSHSFGYYFGAYDDYYYSRAVSGEGGDPLRFEVRGDDLEGEGHYALTLEPTTFPLPEQSKSFQVFVTAFYNQFPPNGWSFVGGDV